MKKKSIIIILAIAIIASVVLVFVACDNGGEADSEFKITVAEAKTIAVAHSGIPTEDVQNASVIPESKKNGTYYHVEFTVEGVKYTYRINSENGDIEKLSINDQTVDKNDVPVPPTNPTSNYIGADRAKEIVFADLNITETDVANLKVEFDFDDGKYLYEIEFVYDGKEYEYEIVGESGEIYKVEADDVTIVTPTPSNPSVVYITVDRAKEIALADCGVTAENAIFDKVKFDREYDTHVYEVEFTVGTVEYEYEINAITGAIIKKEIEDDDSVTAPTENIGAERAMAIAIAHSAVPESAIYGKEVKLEVEKGVYVYEVEFKAQGYEYEYEINAKTGDIISVEKEIDD